MVRVGPSGEEAALARPGARLMVMAGRAMAGYVQVEPKALDARSVRAWIKLARAHVETLPAKNSAKRSKRAPS